MTVTISELTEFDTKFIWVASSAGPILLESIAGESYQYRCLLGYVPVPLYGNAGGRGEWVYGYNRVEYYAAGQVRLK